MVRMYHSSTTVQQYSVRVKSDGNTTPGTQHSTVLVPGTRPGPRQEPVDNTNTEFKLE